MKLHLLRHGIAEASGARQERERRLTHEGAQKMRMVAAGIRGLGMSFDTILSSPFARARQTAEILAEEMELTDALEITDALIYTQPFEALLEALNQKQSRMDSVVLVGHEPFLGELLSLLVTGERTNAFAMKKAGFARLSVDRLIAGRCARLDWLVPPKFFTGD